MGIHVLECCVNCANADWVSNSGRRAAPCRLHNGSGLAGDLLCGRWRCASGSRWRYQQIINKLMFPTVTLTVRIYRQSRWLRSNIYSLPNLWTSIRNKAIAVRSCRPPPTRYLETSISPSPKNTFMVVFRNYTICNCTLKVEIFDRVSLKLVHTTLSAVARMSLMDKKNPWVIDTFW